jgi:hypothetical protein
MTDHTDQTERFRLESELDRTIRECDALRDIQRSAQFLVDAIHLRSTGADVENLFIDGYVNLKAALRAYYQPNGTGR